MEKWARIKYQPNLPLGENRTYITDCEEHRELSRRAAAEGMVLLKNEKNLLPLPNGSRIALFGKATFDFVQGGGGSGEVHSAYRRNIYEGFRKKKDAASIFEPLADFYRTYVEEQYGAGVLPGFTREPELPGELVAAAADFTDLAVISICRFSGEGWDRRTLDTPDGGVSYGHEFADSAKTLFDRGDFYLTAAEELMVNTVLEHFQRVIVVLNIGGVMDTSWFYQNDRISSVLHSWSGGMEGGLAVADILMGDVNPSGHLVDTFARRLEDYPSTEGFHDSIDYVDYKEDIYVGYRYFETMKQGKDLVCYPFGHGLSYTTFRQELVSADGLSMQVAVTNTGARAGKEVVQVYVEGPTSAIGRPARVLAAFAKTRELAPGETQVLTLNIDKKSIGVYDDLGHIQKSAWILEAGTYRFCIGGDVRSAQPVYSLEIPAMEILEQLTQKLAPKQLPGRLLADGTLEVLPLDNSCKEENYSLPILTDDDLEGNAPNARGYVGYKHMCPVTPDIHSFAEVAEGKITLEEFMDQLSIEHLVHLIGGQPNTGVSNTYGFGNLPEFGIPNPTTCDGPAGVRIEPCTGIRTTCWPCATALACTWNTELVQEVGVKAALEVKENNMAMWLAPALNIHRSPLCGRNFEYYSEDPLIAGKIGAAMVRGIQSQKISACIKHFAFNSKETNRKHSDSRVSERAAREIYLRGFEIIVKEANPWAVMSSYNKVNGIHASQNRELLTDILRDEWGFDGFVTTDWWTFCEEYPEHKAGNDLKMGCGYPERTMEALKLGLITEEEIRLCAERILKVILRFE